MSMSRKDFESLAADIKWQVDSLDPKIDVQKLWDMQKFVRLAILPTLRDSNPLFDSERFLAACGF